MANQNFIWADLSTYAPEKSKDFYQKVFGWQFHNEADYWLAYNGTKTIAGLYETPDFFKKNQNAAFLDELLSSG